MGVTLPPSSVAKPRREKLGGRRGKKTCGRVHPCYSGACPRDHVSRSAANSPNARAEPCLLHRATSAYVTAFREAARISWRAIHNFKSNSTRHIFGSCAPWPLSALPGLADQLVSSRDICPS